MHHGEADDLFTHLKALLKHLGDGVFGDGIVLRVHDGVVQIGVELIACVADDLRSGKDETIDELVLTMQKLMK